MTYHANQFISGRIFPRRLQTHLPSALPQFLLKQRWFGGKARTIRSVEVSDIVPFHSDALLLISFLPALNMPADLRRPTPSRWSDTRANSCANASCLEFGPENSPQEILLKDALIDEQFLDLPSRCDRKRSFFTWNRGQIRAVSTSALHLCGARCKARSRRR